MKRERELEQLILKHKALYYEGTPEISDIEYDKLEVELKKINPNNPALSLVGSVVTSSDKVKHDTKMLSLDKTYSMLDLAKWVDDKRVLSMYKLDGISCSAIFDKGNLVQVKTRGDGSFGENITERAKWVASLPKTIALSERIEVRGELYCTGENFLHLCQRMETLGLDRPTSQRNIVAGLIGRKDHISLCEYIDFKAFDLISDLRPSREEEKLKLMSKQGFDICEYEVHTGSNELAKTIENAALFMNDGDYQIDGLVFVYDDLSLHEEMGATAHHPRYKIAFKFQGEAKRTRLKDIEWNVSRNGFLTPVGIVEPVELSGAMISRVTLHNYGIVKQFNIKQGDEIEIIRSGEVIPKFLAVVEDGEGKFKVPSKCPSCASKLEIRDIRLVCCNDKCPAKNREVILNFIQKIGIDDISAKRLEEMIRAEIVAEISDLYNATKEQFLTLDKVKEKLADKFVASIEKSKHTTLAQFLAALGISGGAINKCEKIVDYGFDTVEKILALTHEELMSVEGFAEKSSTEFLTSLEEKKPLIKKLMAHGFAFEKREVTQTLLSGKKICITGALSEKRSTVEGWIKSGGGIPVGSVSKNTDMLLTNESELTSSKAIKALELKIPIISEEKLKQMLGLS